MNEIIKKNGIGKQDLYYDYDDYDDIIRVIMSFLLINNDQNNNNRMDPIQIEQS